MPLIFTRGTQLKKMFLISTFQNLIMMQSSKGTRDSLFLHKEMRFEGQVHDPCTAKYKVIWALLQSLILFETKQGASVQQKNYWAAHTHKLFRVLQMLGSVTVFPQNFIGMLTSFTGDGFCSFFMSLIFQGRKEQLE